MSYIERLLEVPLYVLNYEYQAKTISEARSEGHSSITICDST